MAKEQEKQELSPTQLIEMFSQMLAEQNQANQQNMLMAITELKKPLPHEQEKIDKERELERRKRVSKIKEAVSNGRAEKEVQFRCAHIKTAEGVMPGGHAFRAQVNSDNCYRPLCIRCFKNFPPIKCTMENIKSGMAMQNMRGITAEMLLAWHIASFPACVDCAKGGCAKGDLRQLKQGFLDPLPEVAPDGKILAEQLSA